MLNPELKSVNNILTSLSWPMLKSLTSSRMGFKLMSLDLPTIMDTSLDEESTSPAERSQLKTNIGKSTFGSAIRTSYLNIKEKKSIIKLNKTKEKGKIDENARKHLVRRHLNEICSKILMKMKLQENDKKHIFKFIKAIH